MAKVDSISRLTNVVEKNGPRFDGQSVGRVFPPIILFCRQQPLSWPFPTISRGTEMWGRGKDQGLPGVRYLFLQSEYHVSSSGILAWGNAVLHSSLRRRYRIGEFLQFLAVAPRSHPTW